MKKILTVALVLLAATSFAGNVTDQICPDGSCTILKDSQSRAIMGFGVRPTPNQNLGINVGMPFYDAPTATWYWYTGTAWTAGTSFTSPVLIPDGTAANPGLAFASAPTSGWYWASNNWRLAISGTGKWSFGDATFGPLAGDTSDVGASTVALRGIYVQRWLQGSKSKTLTDAAGAVSFVRIAVPTNANIGGKVIYTATSTDGANGSLTSTAEYNFSGADIAGTVTCGISAQLGVATAYARANTLLCTVTAVTSTTNCDLQATCTDNKAGDQTIAFNWRLDMPIVATVTPQ